MCYYVYPLLLLHSIVVGRLIFRKKSYTFYQRHFIHFVDLDVSANACKQGKRKLSPKMFPELLQAGKNRARAVLIEQIKFLTIHAQPQSREQFKDTLPILLRQESLQMGIRRVERNAERDRFAVA